MWQILDDKTALIRHIIRRLHAQTDARKIFSDNEVNRQTGAGVLLLLGPGGDKKGKPVEPCLILNKRSLKVRQPGDLCFPGGSISPFLDRPLSKLFSLPLTPLGRWKYWPQWKRAYPQAARLLALLWATGLRESLEEMRLNPFGAEFLGPLPPQNLEMFQRKIYPMVTWVKHQKRFYPNWEVEKILHIPLRQLLDPAQYRRYRLGMKIPADTEPSKPIRDFPCFRFQDNGDREILWGATYRITTVFMQYVFGFNPPGLETLPVIEGRLDKTYLKGQA
jgi:8-oxo-dGTP pyrophosphatase MutT (NUDIX family)